MEARKLLDALHVAEKLKDETRHCTTTKGAPENVASHSWRMALMAYFMTDEFPTLDMDKVIKMCLIHDLGEKPPGAVRVRNGGAVCGDGRTRDAGSEALQVD